MVSVYRVLVTVRKHEAFIFFSERANQKPRNRSDKFFEFTLGFILMIPQIFEFFQKYGFPRIVFFRKVKDTNIDSKIGLEFYSAHFGVRIDSC